MQTKVKPARPGFTLVELLVAIAIIAILLSLAAAGTFQVMEGQRASVTETTLQVVHRTLKAHIDAVMKKADDDFGPGVGLAAIAKTNAMTMAGGDVPKAKVIMRNMYLKREFPTSFAEAQASVAGMPKKYDKDLQGANTSGNVESSTCLLLALKQGRGGVSPLDETTLAGAIADVNGDGLPELIDNWGTPLFFALYPVGGAGSDTNNVLPNPPPKNGDFTDPNGVLLPLSWPGRITFESTFHKISPDGQRAYFLVPSIASAGKDRRLGLGPFMNITNAGDATDNIYSHLLKVGQN